MVIWRRRGSGGGSGGGAFLFLGLAHRGHHAHHGVAGVVHGAHALGQGDVLHGDVLVDVELGHVDDHLVRDVGRQADHLDGVAEDLQAAAQGDALGLARDLHGHMDVDLLVGIDAVEVHMVHLVLVGVVLHHPDEGRPGGGLAVLLDHQVEDMGGADLLVQLAEGQVGHDNRDVHALVVVEDAGHELLGAQAPVGTRSPLGTGLHGEAELFLHDGYLL